jgi:DNA modification methylase
MDQGIIFDPFMGSGTTGRAAKVLGHQYLGFELDAQTCEMANEYIESDREPTLPLS